MAGGNCLWSRWFKQKRKKNSYVDLVLIHKKQNRFYWSWKTDERVTQSAYPVKFVQSQMFLLNCQCFFCPWSSTFFACLIPSPTGCFLPWYLIISSYVDLGKGSSPPEIRPLYVLGDGDGGGTFSVFWGFSHVSLTLLEWLYGRFQRGLEPVCGLVQMLYEIKHFLISQT